MVWLGFWDGEHVEATANSKAGSARRAEAAEGECGGGAAEQSSGELMHRQEGEIGKERGSARFLSPQRSSGAAMSLRKQSGTAAGSSSKSGGAG